MEEKDDIYTEVENNGNQQNNEENLNQEPNIENQEEEKFDSEAEDEKQDIEEEKQLEEKKSNPMASFLNIVQQVKKQNKENKEDIIDTTNEKKEDEKIVEDFDEALLKECQREDEENEKKINEKELQKKLKAVRYYNFKDYFLLCILFISSSFNFNYLSLYYVGIGIIYLILLENLNEIPKKIKYYLEIFTIGYASYSLLFKVVTVILAIEDNDYVLNHKETFINFGVAFLHDKDSPSPYYAILSFFTEIVMIFSSGYGIFVSFTCRTLKADDINLRRMKNITIRKLILIAYIFIIFFSVFNISYLTLFYVHEMLSRSLA